MSQIPFPHGLDVFQPIEQIETRIVSPELYLDKQYHFPSHSRSVAYKILEIVSKRKAKGDWSKWESVPKFNVCRLQAVDKVDYENLIDVN